MPNFRFGQNPSGNVYSLQDTRQANATSRRHTVAANPMSQSASQSAGGRASTVQTGYQVERFNPAYDRLEEGSVIEDWIPRDLPGINKMLRIIYTRDAICGPATDIMSFLPWSEYDLQGIDDPAIMRFFEEASQLFGDKAQEMPAITIEYLALGRFCASLIYNETKGYWDDFVAHDSDFLTITPIPVRNFDPKIDLMLSPGMRQFISSMDYRDKAAMTHIPEHLIAKMRSGQPLPLDPLNTLYLRRKSSPYDFVGTSLYTRIIPFWALEKALMNATVTAARRRAGNILHVTIGLDDKWEPTQAEMEDIAGLFIQADEDPVGAVVATRTGVEANEIRDAGSLWKWSDEWSTFAEGKMRGLGISEALLAGDATYNNMEQARSVFTEQIRTLRGHLTSQVYYKLFKTLARAHGFRKRKKSDLDHRVRTGEPPKQKFEIKDYGQEEFQLEHLAQDEALEIPDDELITPTMHWRKSLLPEGDREYLEMLEMLKEQGIPIPLKVWAARAGYDLNEAVGMLEEDKQLRAKIKESTGEGEGGDDAWGEAESDTNPYWDASDRFMQLKKSDARVCLQELVDIVHQPGNKTVLADTGFIVRHVAKHMDGNQRNIELMSYVLMRLGVAHSLPVSEETMSDIAGFFATDEHISEKKRATELHYVAKISSTIKTSNITDGDMDRIAASALKIVAQEGTPLRDSVSSALRSPSLAPQSPTLLSGATR